MDLRLFVGSLFCAVAVAMAISSLSLGVKGFAETYMAEDGAVEMAGAVLFLVAAILAAIALARGAGWMAAPLGALGFFAFLDEMSYGERYFDFAAPRIHGIKIDGAHDFLALSWIIVDSPRLYLALALAAAALSAIVAWRIVTRFGGLGTVLSNPIVPILAAAIILIAAGQFIDYGFGMAVIATGLGRDTLALVQQSMFEEAIEFTAALLVCAAAIYAVGPGAARVAGAMPARIKD